MPAPVRLDRVVPDLVELLRRDEISELQHWRLRLLLAHYLAQRVELIDRRN